MKLQGPQCPAFVKARMKAVASMTSKYYERQAPEFVRSAGHHGSGKGSRKAKDSFKYDEVEIFDEMFCKTRRLVEVLLPQQLE